MIICVLLYWDYGTLVSYINDDDVEMSMTLYVLRLLWIIVQMWNVDCNCDTLWYWILSYFGTEYATSDTQRYKGEIDVMLS